MARDVLLDAARYYYEQMNEPWAVADVAMDRAIEWAHERLGERQPEIHEEASARWIDRWERGQLEDEMRRTIEATYRRLRGAERGSRKNPKQLDREIAQALGK